MSTSSRDQLEAAIGLLEDVLKAPYMLTPAWVSIDPIFASLKGRPRFERLLRKGS